MNNKRYVLTSNCIEEVELWELDSARVVKKFDRTFQSARDWLSDLYDMAHSRECPLPQSWVSFDIKLGVSSCFCAVHFI